MENLYTLDLLFCIEVHALLHGKVANNRIYRKRLDWTLDHSCFLTESQSELYPLWFVTAYIEYEHRCLLAWAVL